MRLHDKHVDDVSLHTYIDTYIHRYIQYSFFLVDMISVGLAQARPNYANNTLQLIGQGSHNMLPLCSYKLLLSLVRAQ